MRRRRRVRRESRRVSSAHTAGSDLFSPTANQELSRETPAGWRGGVARHLDEALQHRGGEVFVGCAVREQPSARRLMRDDVGKIGELAGSKGVAERGGGGTGPVGERVHRLAEVEEA